MVSCMRCTRRSCWPPRCLGVNFLSFNFIKITLKKIYRGQQLPPVTCESRIYILVGAGRHKSVMSAMMMSLEVPAWQVKLLGAIARGARKVDLQGTHASYVVSLDFDFACVVKLMVVVRVCTPLTML